MVNKKLILAIQKDGKLTKPSLTFLQIAGLNLKSENNLFTTCVNFPLEIIFVRQKDILTYLHLGAVDLGIVGKNIIKEIPIRVVQLLSLQFGQCSLNIAVPKDSQITQIQQLQHKTIVTTHPIYTKKYFKNKGIPIKIVPVGGSAEIAPSLHVADAIVDLSSTGKTLAMHNLVILDKLFDSEAILIKRYKTGKSEEKLIDVLTKKFNSILLSKT